jgi:hypothetical protein
LNATEEDISNGVQRIALTHFLQSNEMDSGPDLYTRQCQRDLWNEVFVYLESSLNKRHAVVTGNPGIGKSRSMAYLLRILLQNERTVIYEARKDKIVYAFIPPVRPVRQNQSSNYKVWTCDYRRFSEPACVALKNSDHYYLIDPDVPAQIASVNAHTVLAASPNRAHFKEFQKRAIKWLMPIWRKEELKSLLAYIKIEGATLTDTEFESRYMNFGGRIRYMFAGSVDCSEYFDDLKESVSRLDLDKLIKALSPDGIDIDQSEQGGPSMVFVYDVLAVPTTFHSTTYKYLKIQGNYRIALASETVRQLAASKYWAEIMDTLNPKSQRYTNNSIGNGRLFELVSSVYLEFPVQFDARSDPETIDHVLQLSTGSRKEFVGTWQEYLVYCSQLQSSINMTGTRELVIPKVTNQPVIDMIDACDRVYQITVGKEHGVNRSKLQEMVEILNLTPQNPLKLYFVILEDRLQEFEWKWEGDFELDDDEIMRLEKLTVKKLGKELKSLNQSTKGNKADLVKRILDHKGIQAETSVDILDRMEKCVEFYIICIPKNPDSKIHEMIQKLHEKSQ